MTRENRDNVILLKNNRGIVFKLFSKRNQISSFLLHLTNVTNSGTKNINTAQKLRWGRKNSSEI